MGFGHDLRCGLKDGERPPCKMGCGMLAAPGWPQSVAECGGLDLDSGYLHKIYQNFIFSVLSCFILFDLVLLPLLGRKSDSACFNHLNVLCDCYQPQPCLSSEISTATCSCSFFLGGFDPAQGKTSKGRALDTCCRGCAKGGEHDVRCQQDAAP